MKGKKLLKLPLGSVFLVPLLDSGYGVGVLARATGKGIAFGYFFGPRVFDKEGVNLNALVPQDAVLVGMFGDLELLSNKWPVIGMVETWSADQWPLMPLGRVDERAGRAWISTYDEKSLDFIDETEVTVAEALQYPYDRLMGAGAVEITLTKLINEN